MKKTEKKTNNKEKEVSTKEVVVMNNISTWFSKNKSLAVTIVAVMLAFLVGYFVKNNLIAATVNGKYIWRSKIVKQLETYYGANILNTTIEQELIKQEADSKNIKVTDTEVAEQIKKIEESMASSGQTLDQALAESGMTRKDLEENYGLNILVEKLLAERVTVTDEDVQKYIDENKDSFPEGTDLEQVKTIVTEQLKQEKMGTQYQSMIDELKAKADIKTVVKY